MYLPTCNVQEQDRDLMPSHLNFHLDFHADSDTDLPHIWQVSELLCNMKGKHPHKYTLQLYGGFCAVFLSAIEIPSLQRLLGSRS